MPLDFSTDRTYVRELAMNSLTPESKSDILSSKEIAGIEIRMLPPYIRDNQTIRFWPFPGYAKLYCLTMVISDVANQLTGHMDLSAFSGIGDHEYLPVNKTIFYWEKQPGTDIPAPNQVHIISSVIKSKEALRETADILYNVKRDNEYQDVVGKLSSIVSDTASAALIANMSMEVASIIGRHLGKVNDKPLGTVINSFTRLHGDWDKLGVNKISINTKKVDFGFELVVRDTIRDRSNRGETQSGLTSASWEKTRDNGSILPL